MPESTQMKKTTESGGQTTAPALEAEAAGGGSAALELQSAVGNAGAAARLSGEGAKDDKSAEEAAQQAKPTTSQVEAVLDDGSKTANDILLQIAKLAKSHKDWPYDCFNNNTVMGKMKAKLNGDQMYKALRLMQQPAPGPARTRKWLEYMVLTRTVGQASPGTYQAILAGAAAAEHPALIAYDALMSYLVTDLGVDPLTAFPSQQAALAPEAVASARFLKWMLAKSGKQRQRRAILGTPSGQLPALATALDGQAKGWDWVADIEATSVTPADKAALQSLCDNASVKARMKLVPLVTGKIGDAARPANAPPPPAAKTLKQQLTEFKNGAATTTEAMLTLIQAAPLAERVSVLKNTALVNWVAGRFATTHPLMIFNITTAERATALKRRALVRLCVARLQFTECLDLFADPAYVKDVAAVLSANNTICQDFINLAPAKEAISPMHEMALRRIGLLLTLPARKAQIATIFDDRTNPDAWAVKAAAPLNADAAKNPVAQLTTALNQNPVDEGLVVRLCGAAGALGSHITGSPAKMLALQTKLSKESFFQATTALGIKPVEHIKVLVAAGVQQKHLRTTLQAMKPRHRVAVAKDDQCVDGLKGIMTGPPMSTFDFKVASNGAKAMGSAKFREWFFAKTAAGDMLHVFAKTDERAKQYAPVLEKAKAWAWLDELPSGAALLPEERDALGRLAAQCTSSRLRKKLEKPAKVSGEKSWASKEASRTRKEKKEGADPGSPVVAALVKELGRGAPRADKALELVGRLVRPADRSAVRNTHKGALQGLLSGDQLARMVVHLKLSLPNQLKWIDEAGKANSAVVQWLLDRAKTQKQVALFDDAAAVDVCIGVLGGGPLDAMPGLIAHVGTLALKTPFWKWSLSRETSLQRLRHVIASKAIPQVIAYLNGHGGGHLLDGLPRAQGLTPADRKSVDSVFMGCADVDFEKKMFATRFDLSLTGNWTSVERGDLKMLYKELLSLPIAHVAGHPKLKTMERHQRGGGSYAEGTGTADIGAKTTTDSKFYEGEGHEYTEKYFDHTVRHEVGHAVDAMLGSKTDLVFNTYGWKEYSQGELEQWITAMNGWDGPQPAPSATEKAEIRKHILEYQQAGQGSIAGPSMPASSLATPDSAWTKFGHIRVVREMNRASTALKYTDRYEDGAKAFSINYYYRRFMLCNQAAADAIPRDYAMFAPAEWFADMYAEFYRDFDGQDDSKLGGNVPGNVKTWFTQNVHTIGGRSPHDIKGRKAQGKKAVPKGQRVNH